MTTAPLGPKPTTPGVDQLVWLIQAAAGGALPAEEFVAAFRRDYEELEVQGRVKYASKEQARLIWDVLWDLEYYSPDPAREAAPADWHTLDQVVKTVQRVAARL
jgi:hypothetical protein